MMEGRNGEWGRREEWAGEIKKGRYMCMEREGEKGRRKGWKGGREGGRDKGDIEN